MGYPGFTLVGDILISLGGKEMLKKYIFNCIIMCIMCIIISTMCVNTARPTCRNKSLKNGTNPKPNQILQISPECKIWFEFRSWFPIGRGPKELSKVHAHNITKDIKESSPLWTVPFHCDISCYRGGGLTKPL